MLTTVGNIGIGLMWGWLLVLIGGRAKTTRQIWLNLFVFAIGSACMGFVIYLLTNYSFTQTLYFLSALALSSFLHLAWREYLTEMTQ